MDVALRAKIEKLVNDEQVLELDILRGSRISWKGEDHPEEVLFVSQRRVLFKDLPNANIDTVSVGHSNKTTKGKLNTIDLEKSFPMLRDINSFVDDVSADVLNPDPDLQPYVDKIRVILAILLLSD